MPYEYTDVEVVRVIDGDTVRLRIHKDYDFGFYLKDTKSVEMNFRLFGINTPELPSAEGALARMKLINLLHGLKRVVTYKPDKYGRWLVDLYAEQDGTEVWINKALLDGGFAKAYLP